MALVEAAFESSANPATPLKERPRPMPPRRPFR